MLILRGAKLQTPRHAEALITNLWQLASGSRGGDTIGLYILGLGDREHVLAISSPNFTIERMAAEMVARDSGANLEEGSLLVHQIMADPEIAAYHLVPAWRNFRNNSQNWGWQRTDSLITTYSTLSLVVPGQIAGAAVVFRPLPGMMAASTITSFASGPGAAEIAYQVGSSYAWVGVKVLRPVLQRRWLRRCLQVQVPTALSFFRPDCVVRTDELAAFWHPQIKAGEDSPFN